VKEQIILGISGYYHDSAAALINASELGCEILAAAQEERYSRKKFDESFPFLAITQCLATAGLGISDVSAVVYYEKPWITFERLLETYLACSPQGLRSFLTAMPKWLGQKFNLKKLIRQELKNHFHLKASELPPIYFSTHHLSHAASGFFPSPFSSAAVLCMDGVGEWATTSAWVGEANKLTPLWQINFPHSLGLLYSAFTGFCGFKVNSGEYKLMGLAPFGTPRFVEVIKEHLIDIKDDGTYRLHLEYFDYLVGFQMTSAKFETLFGVPARQPEDKIRDVDLDLAASIQAVTEEVILKMARTLRRETGKTELCLSGGVALNCVANGKILAEKIFDRIWIQPASGDSGGALGAALAFAHLEKSSPRFANSEDSMQASLLGNAYSADEIEMALNSVQAKFHRLDWKDVPEVTAKLLEEQKVVGWYQGRMEYGPRALGNRSILADARNPEMQKQVNLKIKFREGFRPFAPLVLDEKKSQYFDLPQESPYMLLVAPVTQGLRKPQSAFSGLEKIKTPWSEIPAVTHVDYSARIQTVDSKRHPELHELMTAFERQTGCAVLLNTSMNVRGEPIVESPLDALMCFMNTDIDALVIGPFMLLKEEQDPTLRDENWRSRFELD
jgi:carbamoyltransferase